MDESLLAAYVATAYRVRLAQGGFAIIRVGHALPAPLKAIVDNQRWAFITAWNPGSRPRSRSLNRVAQHALVAELKSWPETRRVLPAIGVGQNDWREPSVVVVGPPLDKLDRLAQRYRQNAYLYGAGASTAGLRWVA